MEAVQERARQLRADRVVADEMTVGEGRGLADVVEQGRQPDDGARGRRGVDRPQRMVPQVLARHLVLRDPTLGRQIG